MTVVMQVKPLYLMVLPSLRTASDQSVVGNVHIGKLTDIRDA
jgi:hypothetical protein